MLTSTSKNEKITLRPLEREDLRFVHELNNNDSIMRYWFEEPFETYTELSQLYDNHVHDQRERRFIIQSDQDHQHNSLTKVGLVELIEIDHIHRRGEFQIIVAPEFQGKGYAKKATQRAITYAFEVLNLYKIYLVVDKENAKAIKIYQNCGFVQEGELVDEFFVNGKYRTAIRMSIFQHRYFADKEKKESSKMAESNASIKNVLTL